MSKTEVGKPESGKPAEGKTKVKAPDQVAISFLVFSKGMPSKIALHDHSLACVDDAGQPVKQLPGTITGVFGMYSRQRALERASRWSASHEGKSAGPDRILLLDAHYKVDNFSLTREQLRETTLAQTGWLHFERIQADYRDELKAMWINWIRRDFNAEHANSLKDVSFFDIARTHPRYISKMMRQDDRIKVIVHPVRMAFAPDDVILGATVRLDPERFADAKIRFLPDIKVSI